MEKINVPFGLLVRGPAVAPGGKSYSWSEIEDWTVEIVEHCSELPARGTAARAAEQKPSVTDRDPTVPGHLSGDTSVIARMFGAVHATVDPPAMGLRSPAVVFEPTVIVEPRTDAPASTTSRAAASRRPHRSLGRGRGPAPRGCGTGESAVELPAARRAPEVRSKPVPRFVPGCTCRQTAPPASASWSDDESCGASDADAAPCASRRRCFWHDKPYRSSGVDASPAGVIRPSWLRALAGRAVLPGFLEGGDLTRPCLLNVLRLSGLGYPWTDVPSTLLDVVLRAFEELMATTDCPADFDWNSSLVSRSCFETHTWLEPIHYEDEPALIDSHAIYVPATEAPWSTAYAPGLPQGELLSADAVWLRSTDIDSSFAAVVRSGKFTVHPALHEAVSFGGSHHYASYFLRFGVPPSLALASVSSRVRELFEAGQAGEHLIGCARDADDPQYTTLSVSFNGAVLPGSADEPSPITLESEILDVFASAGLDCLIKSDAHLVSIERAIRRFDLVTGGESSGSFAWEVANVPNPRGFGPPASMDPLIASVLSSFSTRHIAIECNEYTASELSLRVLWILLRDCPGTRTCRPIACSTSHPCDRSLASYEVHVQRMFAGTCDDFRYTVVTAALSSAPAMSRELIHSMLSTVTLSAFSADLADLIGHSCGAMSDITRLITSRDSRELPPLPEACGRLWPSLPRVW